ncbi:MAG: hypothetical protein DHS20C14_20960 [Phycisphaeraceae bacterium]|nr:MAG: hypothetical protein DHS20C14_20960 [Phycisphaeraceae bacterium]
MDIKMCAPAAVAAAMVGLSVQCDAGVLYKVTLEGEITFVGELIGTPLGDMPIGPRASDRWSMTVVYDAGSPDELSADLVRYRSSVVSGMVGIDDHEMALAFDTVGTGVELGSAGGGSLAFAGMLMGELDVSVDIGGVDLGPGLAMPDAVDAGQVSHANFGVRNQIGHTLIAGSLDGYTLEVITPAPSCVAVLGLAGVGAATRRRRA